MAARVPARTRSLLDRVDQGDREAVYDLTRLLRPDDLTELVQFVTPDAPPRPALFDVLADAYAAYRLDPD